MANGNAPAPDNLPLQNVWAEIVERRGDLPGAVAQLRRMAARRDLTPFQRGVTANNLGWRLLRGDAAQRAEGLQLAEEAYRLLPWVSSVENTLGAAQLRNGFAGKPAQTGGQL